MRAAAGSECYMTIQHVACELSFLAGVQCNGGLGLEGGLGAAVQGHSATHLSYAHLFKNVAPVAQG